METNLTAQPIVFLDIDGVLQPIYNEKRFDIDMEALQYELAEKFDDDIYLKIDKYDVAAIWVDWEKEAVDNLKNLLDQTGAKLVLSTSWRRFHVHKELIAMFRLHGLENYLAGQTRMLSHFDGQYIGFEDYESQEIWHDSRYHWPRIKEMFDLEEYGEAKYKVYSESEIQNLENLRGVRERIHTAKKKCASRPVYSPGCLGIPSTRYSICFIFPSSSYVYAASALVVTFPSSSYSLIINQYTTKVKSIPPHNLQNRTTSFLDFHVYRQHAI